DGKPSDESADAHPPDVRALRPELSHKLASAVRRALARDPAQRHFSALQFEAALRQVPEGGTSSSLRRLLVSPTALLSPPRTLLGVSRPWRWTAAPENQAFVGDPTRPTLAKIPLGSTELVSPAGSEVRFSTEAADQVFLQFHVAKPFFLYVIYIDPLVLPWR